MKKILLAIMAVASIALVGCKTDGNNPDEPNAKTGKKFTIAISHINSEGAHIAVTAKDSTMSFYMDAISSAELKLLGSDDALYQKYIENIKKHTEKGKAEYDFVGIPEDTEVTVFAFEIDGTGALVGEVEKHNFTTSKFVAMSNNTFKFEKKDSIITITPSNLEEDYAFAPLLTEEEIAEGYSVMSILRMFQPYGTDVIYLGKGITEVSLNEFVYAGSHIMQVCAIKITKETIQKGDKTYERNEYQRIGEFVNYAFTYTVEEGANEPQLSAKKAAVRNVIYRK